MKVAKVGRKYFTTQKLDDTSGWSTEEYHLDDWSQKTDYCADSCLYASEEQWAIEKQQRKLVRNIEDFINRGMLRSKSIEDLKQIFDILSKD